MKFKLVLGLSLTIAGMGLPVLAHGVIVEHRSVKSIEVQARFDTGEPMAQAQVLVYAPDNPTEAWQQSTTDDQGRFSFVPDETLPGNWEVMVRQAGHGAIATIPVSAGAAGDSSATVSLPPEDGESAPPEAEPSTNSVVSPSTRLSPVQRGITIGSVIWGFIGTALFFARGKR